MKKDIFQGDEIKHFEENKCSNQNILFSISIKNKAQRFKKKSKILLLNPKSDFEIYIDQNKFKLEFF